jgi:hypothetical protein
VVKIFEKNQRCHIFVNGGSSILVLSRTEGFISHHTIYHDAVAYMYFLHSLCSKLFASFKYMVFIMHLDIAHMFLCIAKAMYLEKPKQPTVWNGGTREYLSCASIRFCADYICSRCFLYIVLTVKQCT